jgi:hypothetical protein
MGHLVFKSGFIPRAICIPLMAGCFGYLVEFTVRYSDYTMTIYPPWLAVSALAEIVFILWLLIKGVRNQKVEVC